MNQKSIYLDNSIEVIMRLNIPVNRNIEDLSREYIKQLEKECKIKFHNKEKYINYDNHAPRDVSFI